MRRPNTLGSYLLLVLCSSIAALVLWKRLEASRGAERIAWSNSWALLLLAGCALVVWVAFHLREYRAPTFAYSRVDDVAVARRGLVSTLSALPSVMRICALGCIVVALARPQTFRTEQVKVEGIDIMIALDLSKSMEELDLKRNRLDAGQRTIRRFLARREGDRIGLVVFAQQAMLQCPLTLDYRALDGIVSNLAIGDVPEMGTAIGDALGLSLASLERSKARSKVVILVSDGDSNVAQFMDPSEAKDLAKKMGVKVFTVLMGEELGRSEAGRRNKYAANPELLKLIARDTGGLYFNAGDDAELESSFDEIRSTLEKSEVKVTLTTPQAELFQQLVLGAAVFLLLEIALVLSRWRRFP